MRLAFDRLRKPLEARDEPFTRFHRRGRSAARTEWRLMAATHNLVKLHKYFTAPDD